MMAESPTIKKIPKRRNRIDLYPYILVGPAVLIVLLVIGYPLVSNIWTSLHNGHLSSRDVDKWVGLRHYINIFTDSELRSVALTTLYISGSTAILGLITGLIGALFIERLKRFQAWVQVLLLTPWVLSGVITGRVWSWLLDPIFGLANHWLLRFILTPFFGIQGPLELTSIHNTAAITVIIASAWKMFPFAFVMILAGLQSIPSELYEAAMVDGASYLQRMRFITLPFLRFILIIVLLLSFVWSFNDFSIIFVMTRGGPGFITMVLPFRVYRYIVDGFRLGAGSALATVMVILLSIIAITYIRLLKRQSEEGFIS